MLGCRSHAWMSFTCLIVSMLGNSYASSLNMLDGLLSELP